MRKLLIIILFFLSSVTYSQVVLDIIGVDTTVTDPMGYVVDVTNETTLTVRNSRFTLNEPSAYMLYAGTDGPSGNDNNMDGAIIWGSYFDCNNGGTAHGVMAGYSINYDFRYNYFDASAYGIVIEGADPMAYTSGGVAYNIFKNNASYGLLIFGQDDVPVYNNVFYNSGSLSYFLGVRENTQFPPTDISTGAKIKNNIFYTTSATRPYAFISINTSSMTDFECDYNVYWSEAGTNNEPWFYVDGVRKTWTQWKALGYDAHSVVLNPNFNNTTDFVPTARLDYGTDLGASWDDGLTTTATWIVGTAPATTIQDGTWQVGTRVYEAPEIADYYLSPTGDDATGDGSIGSPFKTFNGVKALLVPGDTVYLRGGTYDISTSQTLNTLTGTKSNPICFFNYPGEKPILDFYNKATGGVAISMYGASYLEFQGIEFKNSRQINVDDQPMGFYTQSCNHIIFRQMVGHHIGQKAFRDYNSDSLFYYNCDAYQCCDSLRSSIPGNGGSGFSVNSDETTTGTYIYYKGCRAWENSDQGFGASTRGTVEYDSCWAFHNGYQYSGSGLGGGFKLGLGENSQYTKRAVRNSISAFNKYYGMNENNPNSPIMEMRFYNNILYANNAGLCMYSNPDTYGVTSIYKNNIIYNSGVSYIQSGTIWTHDHNNWDTYSSHTTTNADFLSIDSTGIRGERQADGSLPDLNFLKLSSTSYFIDRGTDVGIAYTGAAPDLGAYEYGSQDPPVEPVVIYTNRVTPGVDRATTGGNVIDDGGDPITDRGVCWATTELPTVNDNRTHNGTGTGTFSTTITGLSPSTTYYVRAYAVNGAGTYYASQVEFTTSSKLYASSNNKIVVDNLGRMVYQGYTVPPPPPPEVVEMLTNGSFTDGTGWSAGGVWTISGGTANYADGTNSSLIQTDGNMVEAIVPSTFYKLEFTVTTAAPITAYIVFNNSGNVITYVALAGYSSGTHIINFTSPADIGVGGFNIRASATSSAAWSIDNVSLKLATE